MIACEPQLTVGEWQCANDAGPAPAPTAPIAVPWSTSFEDRFCDYEALGGFCYGDRNARFEIVTEPVHSGRRAAAFRLNTKDPDAQQARCVRRGELPRAAYYGAWYFVPESHVTGGALWNLLHFRGGTGDEAAYHHLLDVTLVDGDNGGLELVVYSSVAARTYRAESPVPVPIGKWFEIQLYLRRAADATGAVALYQDGKLLIDVSEVVTDDSTRAQWYVGNLAYGLNPTESTLYVDDVSISASR